MAGAQTRYISSLDGLRAFAVLAVIAYHLKIGWAQSGLLGVTLFFVLSGYLITGLLIAEWEKSHSIDLPHFWLRRVRRLVPAIVTLIVVVAALCTMFNHVLLTKMRPDIVPSLFFYTNWWYIFRDLSYFDALGSPSPLTHFWSLAIEEQFYLIWPIILLFLFKLGKSKVFVRRTCLVLAGISVLLMALLYVPNGDPSRVYYGTDTRAMSLLIGAWLAFMWPGQQLTEKNTRGDSNQYIWAADMVGVGAFAAIVIIMVNVSAYSGFLYYGGIFLVSVLTALLIAVLVHPRSHFARLASAKPLVWIGKRSYGMYLWHYPLLLLLAPHGPNVSSFPWWYCVLIIALTIGVAGLSYRFIEKPIRAGKLEDLVRSFRNGEEHVSLYLRRNLAPAICSVVVLAIACVGCAVVPDTSEVPEDAIVSTGLSADQAMTASQLPQASVTDTPQSTVSSAGSAASHEDGVYDPLLIGDSVPGDSQDEFNANYPYGLMDSYIGRRPSQALDVLNGYISQGVVGHVVVLAAFSNTTPSADDLDALIDACGTDRAVYLINISIPDDFQDEANSNIVDAVNRHANAHLIDWASTCGGHEDEYLWNDNTHLTPTGARAYEKMILEAITPDLPAEDVASASALAPDESAPAPDYEPATDEDAA